MSSRYFISRNTGGPSRLLLPFESASESHLYRAIVATKISSGSWSEAIRNPQNQRITRTAPKNFLNNSRRLPGHYPVKQGFWGKSHQKVHPNVRQNLCHSFFVVPCRSPTSIASKACNGQPLSLSREFKMGSCQCAEMGPKVCKKWFLGGKVGNNASKPTDLPTSNQFRNIGETRF